jgi:hypothetical protein
MQTDEVSEQLMLISEHLSTIVQVIRQQELLVETLRAEGRSTARVESLMAAFKDIGEKLRLATSQVVAEPGLTGEVLPPGAKFDGLAAAYSLYGSEPLLISSEPRC